MQRGKKAQWLERGPGSSNIFFYYFQLGGLSCSKMKSVLLKADATSIIGGGAWESLYF